jgi:hypothetical protein
MYENENVYLHGHIRAYLYGHIRSLTYGITYGAYVHTYLDKKWIYGIYEATSLVFGRFSSSPKSTTRSWTLLGYVLIFNSKI